MRLGFVGLGTMGLPMAQRLLKAGHELSCVSRSPGPAEQMQVLGARIASLAEVVTDSEVTFLCLPDDDTVRSVIEQAMPAIKGRTVVDCSTIAPATAVGLGDLVGRGGGEYLDAPVSGGPAGARNGTLSVMVGGSPAAFEQVQPALSAFSGHARLVGGVGAGQVVKLCNQVVVGAQLLAVAECAELVRRSGIDPAHLHDALIHSTGDCVMARTRFPVPGVIPNSPASNDWRPDFTTTLMAKDLRIAADYAAEHRVDINGVGALLDLLRMNEAEGRRGLDWSSFALLLADR